MAILVELAVLEVLVAVVLVVVVLIQRLMEQTVSEEVEVLVRLEAFLVALLLLEVMVVQE